jgi:hypothetical protein
VLNVTCAVEVRLFGRVKLVAGLAVPLVGPRLFDVEGLSQFRFDY